MTWVQRWRRNSPLVVVSPGKTAWQNSQTLDCRTMSDIMSPSDGSSRSLGREGLSLAGIWQTERTWHLVLRKNMVKMLPGNVAGKDLRSPYPHSCDFSPFNTPTPNVCFVLCLLWSTACPGWFVTLDEAPGHLVKSQLKRGATICSSVPSSSPWRGTPTPSLDMSSARRSEKVPMFEERSSPPSCAARLRVMAVSEWGLLWRDTGISWVQCMGMDFKLLSCPLGTLAPADRAFYVC